jgi:DNA-directed RNA polymerase specialized sigma subunit
MKKTNRLIAIGNEEVNIIVDRNVNGAKFEPDDKQQELLTKANKLPFTQRELLGLNYDSSLRDIQSEFGINYMYVHRTIKRARETILGDNMNQYNNKRLKHKKNGSK